MTRSTVILLIAVLLALGWLKWGEPRMHVGLHAPQPGVTMDPSVIDRIRITTRTGTMQLERHAAHWSITEPLSAPASLEKVSALLDAMHNLQWKRLPTEAHHERAALGLDPPVLDITFYAGNTSNAILLGKTAPGEQEIYALCLPSRTIGLVNARILPFLPSSPSDLRERKLFPFTARETIHLELKTAARTLEFARESDGWNVVRPFHGRALDAALRQLIEETQQTRMADFIAESTTASALYGLDDPVAQIAIEPAAPASGGRRLLLGKYVYGSDHLVYAAMEGGNTVFAVSNRVLRLASTELSQLMDPHLVQVSEQDIATLRIEMAGGVATLERMAKGWKLTSPRHAPADAARVNELLSALVRATAKAYPDIQAAASSNHPQLSITYWTAAATPETQATPFSLSILDWQPDLQRARVWLTPQNRLCEADIPFAGPIPPSPLYFVDRQLFVVSPDQVRQIIFQQNGEKTIVDTRDISNRDAPKMLQRLCTVQASEIISDQVAALDLYELDHPLYSITLDLTDKDLGISKTLLIGAPAIEGGRYAMMRGGDFIFRLDPDLLEALLSPLQKQ